jgi:putative ABC transport system substrate-binding protein
MRRRDFIAVIGSAAASSLTWPLAARAQQPGKLPTIGFLGTDASAWTTWTAAFVARLRELGWIEGRTIAIEYRWSQGRSERVAETAAEFVRLNVGAIVTYGGAVAAFKRATTSTPIVFAIANDPVGGGLVASLARPGGNATGLSQQSTDLAGKRLELLREIVPGLGRLAILANAGYRSALLEMAEVQSTARASGLEAFPLEIRQADDIASAFEGLKGRADALYVVVDTLISANRTRIATSALAAQLPTIYDFREHVALGGLMSYGPNIPSLFRRAAEYVDKILHGTKPADLPVEQPTQYDLVINLKTAKALDLKIPETFLLRADEVIE